MKCDFGCQMDACLAGGITGEPPVFLCLTDALDLDKDLRYRGVEGVRWKMLDAVKFIAQGGCMGCWNGAKHVHWGDKEFPSEDWASVRNLTPKGVMDHTA